MGLGVPVWPEALKREIVAASFAPGSSVSVVAPHYDVNANLVFGCRKHYRACLRCSPNANLQTKQFDLRLSA